MAKKKLNREDDDLEDDLDDEEFDVEDEEEDGGGKGGKKHSGKKRVRLVDDAAAEDDDEDDDEDGGRRGGKKKRSMFIDDIADVDDDEEEEEDDEEAEDLIDDRDVEIPEEANAAQGHVDYGRLNREREERSAEEIARFIEEKYQSMEEGGYGYEDAAALAQTGAVGQQAMQPTINDPKLWLLHCRPGHERELVTQLLQKYYSFHVKGTPLLIKSAVALDHLKGYIYVEAEKEANVRDAIKGLRNVFVSKGVQLVPLDQMVEAITVNRKARATIGRDSWVRLRNGLYKDDLARVVEVDNAAQKATIRVVPRLDLQAMANRDEEARKKNPFGRGPVRPPARPFNAEEARNVGLVMSRATGADGQMYIQIGSQRFVAGYVERDVAFKSLTVIEGVPPLEELQRYNACGAAADDMGRSTSAAAAGVAGDLSALVAALPTGTVPKTTFVKGDLVAITEGELKGIEGYVSATREDGKVMVRPKVEGFNDEVDFDNEHLRKVFKVGDRVRVVSGPYSGESGIVLQVIPDNDQCTIISDTTKQEIKTFGRDCTATDVSNTGVDVLGEYQLHDLVQIDQHTAGVIILIQREAARVLTSASSPEQADVRVLKAADMLRKVKTRNLLTSDANNNQVRCGDYVTFQMAGANSRQQQKGGTVEYVWRGQLFLKVKDYLDTGGFVCVRASKCRVRGGATSNNGIDLARQVASGIIRGVSASPSLSPQLGRTSFSYMPASPSQFSQQSVPQQSPGSTPNRNGAGSFRPPPPRMGGANGAPGAFSGATNHGFSGSQLAGRSVRVVGGQYNGYKGRVKHETASHVQLELDAISGRIVTVEKRFIRDEASSRANGISSRPHPSATSNGRSDSGYSGSALPYGSRTPLHPSQTPLHPSMTPSHYSMTPAHAPYTPMHAPTPMDDNYQYGRDQDDRSHHTAHTPGLAAYTPSAYTPSAATPAMYTDTHQAPTPALDPGTVGPPPVAGTPGFAPTPGGVPASAPTPFLSAATPAITPGDLSAPTPGMDGMVGTTPGLAPTPYMAATPQLPAATPGLDMGTGALDNFHLWEGIVVTVGEGNDTAVVCGLGGSLGLVRVLAGSFPAGGGNFQEDGGQEEEVPGSHLHLVKPNKKDRVKVLHSDPPSHIGGVGSVVGMVVNDNQNDCIIKMENNEMCIADLRHVGKMAMQVLS